MMVSYWGFFLWQHFILSILLWIHLVLIAEALIIKNSFGMPWMSYVFILKTWFNSRLIWEFYFLYCFCYFTILIHLIVWKLSLGTFTRVCTLFKRKIRSVFYFFKLLGLCFRKNLPRVPSVPRSHTFIVPTRLAVFTPIWWCCNKPRNLKLAFFPGPTERFVPWVRAGKHRRGLPETSNPL